MFVSRLLALICASRTNADSFYLEEEKGVSNEINKYLNEVKFYL